MVNLHLAHANSAIVNAGSPPWWSAAKNPCFPHYWSSRRCCYIHTIPHPCLRHFINQLFHSLRPSSSIIFTFVDAFGTSVLPHLWPPAPHLWLHLHGSCLLVPTCLSYHNGWPFYFLFNYYFMTLHSVSQMSLPQITSCAVAGVHIYNLILSFPANRKESLWQRLNLHWILHMTNVVLSRPCHLPQFVGRTMAPSLRLLPTSVESFVEPCGRATQLSQYYRFLLTTQLSSCFALYTFKFSWLSWTHVSWHLFICLWPWL